MLSGEVAIDRARAVDTVLVNGTVPTPLGHRR
jgi:hypothetical protein